jgi:hypothetical protein
MHCDKGEILRGGSPDLPRYAVPQIAGGKRREAT